MFCIGYRRKTYKKSNYKVYEGGIGTITAKSGPGNSNEYKGVVMTGNTLARQFEFCLSTMEKNLGGLTNEESLLQPAAAGNCANWIAGHIVATRNGLHSALGLDPGWPSADAERYKRGAAPITGTAGTQPLESIIALYKKSQAVLIEALGALTDEALSQNIEGRTLAEIIAGFSFHESYHVGQLGLLRRMVGKPGVIK